MASLSWDYFWYNTVIESMKTPIMLKLALLSLIAVTLATGCSLGNSPAQKELNAAKIMWDSANIEDYQFELRVSCFCPQEIVQPVLINVVDGIAVALVYADNGSLVTTELFARSDTVDKLFEIIQEAINSEADSLKVTYDKHSGYPVSVIIDQIAEAVDEEISYFVSNLTPLS